MKERQYESPFLDIVLLQTQDIITNSPSGSNESADDLGGWNNNWFPKNNG